MSDLTGFRDHARRMATASHRPDCTSTRPGRWGGPVEVHPNPDCQGCVTQDDRVLWTRLADETDRYLDRHTDDAFDYTTADTQPRHPDRPGHRGGTHP